MIDALFGSKTRVKLLHLFLNNPGQSFFVREITRKIDEQINSVRRELSNMLDVGVITSSSSDNKLYYQVNQRYEYFLPLRAIFGDSEMKQPVVAKANDNVSERYESAFSDITGLRVAIFSGVLIKGSTVNIDVLMVGNVSLNKVRSVIGDMEKAEGREINYTVLSYDEFYYRLSVRDRFLVEILNSPHKVVVDKDSVISKDSREEL